MSPIYWVGSPKFTAGHPAPLIALVHHRMVGTLRSTDAAFTSTDGREASTNFGVGYGCGRAGHPTSAHVHQYVRLGDQAWVIDPNPDLVAIAEGRGWTLEEALAQQRAADAVGAVAVQVAKTSPEAFVGSALATSPGGPPTLYVKGAVEPWVQELVASSPVRIVIADGQPYSFDELENRKMTVHHALEDVGYQNVVTEVNITGGGVIPASVAREEGLPDTPRSIVERLPKDLQADVRLTVLDPSAFRDTLASISA